VTSTTDVRLADARERLVRPEPEVSARRAGLRYTTDDRPGITRRRSGRGFSYRGADGQPIHDRSTLTRIRSLAVPPAWTEVWICPYPNGHLQATGRDARGRKQYRYHPGWRARRDDSKFERIVAFATLLPRVRRRCDRDLARRGLSREKVLAAVVRLLELTLIRVGNDEYARLNRSFGLATMKDRHADVRGSTIRFRFRGKSGRRHEVDIRDRRLAAIVRRCQELPGQELFQYIDGDGQTHDVTSDDVNDYLREMTEADITTRDFRIWAGTVMAYRAIRALDHGDETRSVRQTVIEAIRISAGALGNTAAVARGSYVHPALLEAYRDGRFEPPSTARHHSRPDGLTPALSDPAAELAVVDLLEGSIDRDSARVATVAAPSRASRPKRPG
jgi:DNA topoisomerase-1